MSDKIKHECGIVMLRLRKPLQYYIDKYGTPLYAPNKVYLLMEKQHNRGQDGVGVANVKINVDPGKRYIFRRRSINSSPIADIFKKVSKGYKKAYNSNPEGYYNGDWISEHVKYSGPMWLGHLRYATHGKNGVEVCHPRLRQNNWRSRNLLLAGNFNMTNVEELFDKLVEIGQHPREMADTITVLEKIGHFLDDENLTHYQNLRYQKGLRHNDLTKAVESRIDMERVLQRSCPDFDGGYVIGGITGHGAAFAVRDPVGIRPAYYYADDEIIVVTSERPAIKTAFNVDYAQIKELQPGNALLIDPDGSFKETNIMPPEKKRACSFERIYFSRGTDPDIYTERKELGRLLANEVLQKINYDFENTVFSYIPNTAETAYIGLMKGLEDWLIDKRRNEFKQGLITDEELDRRLKMRPRTEKLVIKDAKLRTFITDDTQRDDLVAHVYDVTYEAIKKNTDTLVVIDDSIVRGTTLQKSILTMLNRLEPKKVIIVSSAPQIRYPDCYGIDMSRMQEFVAFRATIALLHDNGQEDLIEQTYKKCIAARNNNLLHSHNFVAELYKPFTAEQISAKIAEIVKPIDMKAEVEVVYQSIDNLHKACPAHVGDWYFTGKFPTKGGNRVVNQSFIYFVEGNKRRAY